MLVVQDILAWRVRLLASVRKLASLPAFEMLLNGRLLAENGTARRPSTPAHTHILEVVYEESS